MRLDPSLIEPLWEFPIIPKGALRRRLSQNRTFPDLAILVYKVDRLTRSLSDFAKIVEVLDARGASFVSITQAFNTTTSMGGSP